MDEGYHYYRILSDLNKFVNGEIDINHINKEDENGESLIAQLISEGFGKLAEQYISGADINYVDKEGCSLLDLSCYAGLENIAKILLEMGCVVTDNTLFATLETRDCSEDFILNTLGLENFSRDNTRFIALAYVTGSTRVLRELLNLNFSVKDDILLEYVRRPGLTAEHEILAIELLNRGGGDVIRGNEYQPDILMTAIANKFEKLAILIVEKYHDELRISNLAAITNPFLYPRKGTYLFQACEANLPKLVATLIEYDHPYDTRVQDLTVSPTVARILADAYPAYRFPFASNLNDVKLVQREDREKIGALVSSSQVRTNAGALPQMPVELYELIINQMDARIQHPSRPLMSPPRQNPSTPLQFQF